MVLLQWDNFLQKLFIIGNFERFTTNKKLPRLIILACCCISIAPCHEPCLIVRIHTDMVLLKCVCTLEVFSMDVTALVPLWMWQLSLNCDWARCTKPRDTWSFLTSYLRLNGTIRLKCSKKTRTWNLLYFKKFCLASLLTLQGSVRPPRPQLLRPQNWAFLSPV